MPAVAPPKKKEVLYVEIPADLKRRLTRLANRRARKISAEATLAIERYIKEEEHKEGLDSSEDED